ncbi:MAG: PilZ domain-containing protein [Candidatus Omnitrophota bacterium]|nr:PilZ domain-containing protein [Candidatus Omnitrophota bacterium]
MQERRKFVRLQSRLQAKCWVIGTEEPLSSTSRNIGGGGISLFTKRRLAPGTVLGIEVSFPGRAAPVRFKGEVIWSGELIASDGQELRIPYETGVRFLEIAPDDREFILQYAEAHITDQKST